MSLYNCTVQYNVPLYLYNKVQCPWTSVQYSTMSLYNCTVQYTVPVYLYSTVQCPCTTVQYSTMSLYICTVQYNVLVQVYSTAHCQNNCTVQYNVSVHLYSTVHCTCISVQYSTMSLYNCTMTPVVWTTYSAVLFSRKCDSDILTNILLYSGNIIRHKHSQTHTQTYPLTNINMPSDPHKYTKTYLGNKHRNTQTTQTDIMGLL